MSPTMRSVVTQPSTLQTVQAIYAAFGRGDMPAILASLSEDVDWEYGALDSNIPWLQAGRGRQAAGAYFASLAGLAIERFEPKSFLDGDRVIVVLVDVAFTVKATGKRVVEEDEVHLWRFDAAGKVVRFRHRSDTQQHALACQG